MTEAQYDGARFADLVPPPAPNGRATVALVFGILALVLVPLGIPLGLVAVATGAAALRRARATASGRVMSLWGIWLGLIPLVLQLAALTVVLLYYLTGAFGTA